MIVNYKILLIIISCIFLNISCNKEKANIISTKKIKTIILVAPNPNKSGSIAYELNQSQCQKLVHLLNSDLAKGTYNQTGEDFLEFSHVIFILGEKKYVVYLYSKFFINLNGKRYRNSKTFEYIQSLEKGNLLHKISAQKAIKIAPNLKEYLE